MMTERDVQANRMELMHHLVRLCRMVAGPEWGFGESRLPASEAEVTCRLVDLVYAILRMIDSDGGDVGPYRLIPYFETEALDAKAMRQCDLAGSLHEQFKDLFHKVATEAEQAAHDELQQRNLEAMLMLRQRNMQRGIK